MENRCFVHNRNFVDENTLREAEKSDRFDDIGETQQDLCLDLPKYKHIDGKYYCILHLPKKDKNRNEFSNSISNIIRKVDSKITEIEKLSEAKQQVEKNKLKYDFRYVWFPCAFSLRSKQVKVKADFKSATFCDHADFQETIFLDRANFGYVSFCVSSNFKFAKFSADAYFYKAEFLGEADFRYTFFSNGKFTKATFSENSNFESSEFVRDANFINVNFLKKVSFQYSKLFIANFENAKFLNIANFKLVEFLNYAFFKGSNENLVFGINAVLDLQDARIEKPEKISFHTVRLSPNWFVNVDSRKFILIDIHFTDFSGKEIDSNSIQLNIKSELNCLDLERGITNSKQLLKIACRQLAENAENNNRFEEASNFRQMAMETEWLEKKDNLKKGRQRILNPSQADTNRPIVSTNFFSKSKQRLKNIWQEIKTSQIIIFHRLYRFSSKFGESSGRAFLILVGIIFISAILYWIPLSRFADKEHFRNLEFIEAIFYSLRVMVLQRPEPFPANLFAKGVLAIESVLAPLQLALLALAIRRKFMR
jgi:uncharacterized protein YjbI with pentapeptide repeats